MPLNHNFIQHIRELVAKDDIATAIKELSALLNNSPKLDEAILQSARYNSVTKQIRLGLINSEDSNVTKNQISLGILHLLREIEDQQLIDPNIKAEVERFTINIQNSKNVVTGNISAGGDVRIGDTTVHTESNTSRRVRLFLFVFVPVLAILSSWAYIRNKNLSEPMNLTVAVDDKTPNPNVPLGEIKMRLTFGDKTDIQTVKDEATFKGIPANFKNTTVQLSAEAEYYEPVSMSFVLTENRVTIPMKRDNSLETISGDVKDENGYALKDVKIFVQDISVETDGSGLFTLHIPFEKQNKTQRIKAFKAGFKVWENETPFIKNQLVKIILKK